METNQKQRVDCLLEGKFYNEIAKQKMKEYKEMAIDTLQK